MSDAPTSELQRVHAQAAAPSAEAIDRAAKWVDALIESAEKTERDNITQVSTPEDYTFMDIFADALTDSVHKVHAFFCPNAAAADRRDIMLMPVSWAQHAFDGLKRAVFKTDPDETQMEALAERGARISVLKERYGITDQMLAERRPYHNFEIS